VFSGGSYSSIPKKKRKKVDTKTLEFLFSYRCKKKRKQYTDCIMISIKTSSNEKINYNEFLQQFFGQIMARFKRDWNEKIYKYLFKEVSRSNQFFKKFLLSLRMFFFTVIKRNDSKKENYFKQQIGNFDIAIKELITGRTTCCSGKVKKQVLSLDPIITLGSSQKAQLIIISKEISDKNHENNYGKIELKVLNFLKKLSESGKRIFFDHSQGFCRKEFKKKMIDGSVLQSKIIVFQLFQGQNSITMNQNF
jgi:hypothetical protein